MSNCIKNFITHIKGVCNGDQINQGPQGFQGPQGKTGSIGMQGATGAQGPIGNQGLIGHQGPQGSSMTWKTIQKLFADNGFTFANGSLSMTGDCAAKDFIKQ